MYMYKVIEWYNANFYKDKTIKFRLKDIFSDHWNNFIKDNPDLNTRPVVFKEVDKMISCRTSDLGYSVYECPDCGEIKFSYHTCKSRLCPSCGNKYVRKRQKLFFKSVITVIIDTLSLLFLITFGIFLGKIENFLIYFLNLFLKLFFLGLKNNLNLKNISLV